MFERVRGRKRAGGNIWVAPLGALGGVIILVLVSFSGSVVFNDCENDQRSKNASEAYRELSPRFLIQFINGTFARCTGAFISANQGEITAMAGVVVAFFTFTLWFVGGRQLQGLRESIERADAAAEQQSADMKRSIKVSQQSADAATLTANVAHESLVQVQRAYIDLKEIGSGVATSSVFRGREGDFFLLIPKFENVGLTRATHVMAWSDYAEVANGGTPAFDIPPPPIEGGTVGPKGPVIPNIIAIPKDAIYRSYRRESELYALIRVDYRDVLTDIPRHNQVCFAVEPRVDPERLFAKGVENRDMMIGRPAYVALCSST